jgi:hypothetical protein
LKGFDDSVLYEALDKPFGDHHKALMDDYARLVIECDVKESKFFGQSVPYEDCIHADHREVNPLDHDENYEPWIVPVDDDFKLLAKNPGIWVKENFLTEEETQGLLDLYRKSDEKGLLAPCVEDVVTDSQTAVNKDCFRVSPEVICTSTHDDSACDHYPDSEEGALLETIIQKAKNAISVDLPVDSFMPFYVARGNTPPQLLHEDVFDVITYVVYLSDGGGATVFPAADVAITPKKGAAAMWLNFHKDGSTNTKAFHGVGAQPLGIGERIVALIEFKSHGPMGPLAPAEVIPRL